MFSTLYKCYSHQTTCFRIFNLTVMIFNFYKQISTMRLNFELKNVVISPASHIYLARHAAQFKGRYASGQLYGSLYQDQAHVTNVMAFPDAENMSSKEDLEAMESRHEKYLTTFNLDTANLGWYMVCYKQNFWDGLEAVQYYEKYMNTSFFLVYDYQAKSLGINPYKAYRLSDKFALQESHSLLDLSDISVKENNPFVEISVFVQKDEIFELLMLNNKSEFIRAFSRVKSCSAQRKMVKQKVGNYIEALDEEEEMQKKLADKSSKQKKQAKFSQFCEYAGLRLKIQTQHQSFKSAESNLQAINKLFKRVL